MRARQFDQLLRGLVHLTRRQRDRLLALLQSAAGLDRVLEIVEQPATPPSCPHCHAGHPYRHGHAHGLQRYRCRHCARTFNALSGTPLARLRHKARWLDYLGCMLDSRSVRRSATATGVAGATSFRWRHRFLQLSKDDRTQRLAGIAEADEMFVLESHKGSRNLERPPRKRGGKATKRGLSNEQMCILVARDRSGQTIDAVTGKGPVGKRQLIEHLGGRLERDVLLVTDGHPAYPAFARAVGIAHEALNTRAGERRRGALHIQNVNAYHSRVRAWLVPFRGIASRYLSHYFGWHWALDGDRVPDADAFLRAALGRFNT
jgi:transposase-like protein